MDPWQADMKITRRSKDQSSISLRKNPELNSIFNRENLIGKLVLFCLTYVTRTKEKLEIK